MNGTPLRSIVSPACLLNLRAMSEPSTTTFEPSSAAVSLRPSVVEVWKVSRPWSDPARLPVIMGGTPMLTAPAWASISIMTAGTTTSTPSTLRTASAVARDIGAAENPPTAPDLSLRVILSA